MGATRRHRRVRVRTRIATVLFASILFAGAGGVVAAPCWRPPVTGTVVDAFREPPCTWCAGNRGLDYEVARPAHVRAAATGRVTFSGFVAGVGYTVVRSADGRRQTYGRLIELVRSEGDLVMAGSLIGRASGTFHFGVRLGDVYVDPAPLLGQMVSRWRLVPHDGSPSRPAPPPEPRCQGGDGRR